ncbi:hypothetical protein PHAVU_011G110400 [Phaseolus vulgaris]|uniref:Uncharacterized protein n=1 Tax=Phaseolus vulgaris TaxID=3885 RepID=V7AH82_PHAVU|nr:hypothetical protein PHAVU_011G110400g [Phaseolus vulgaris]ESW04615.1 hypothetical protein PHAVU_011G110400g [Phaseolus vulgaris]
MTYNPMLFSCALISHFVLKLKLFALLLLPRTFYLCRHVASTVVAAIVPVCLSFVFVVSTIKSSKTLNPNHISHTNPFSTSFLVTKTPKKLKKKHEPKLNHIPSLERILHYDALLRFVTHPSSSSPPSRSMSSTSMTPESSTESSDSHAATRSPASSSTTPSSSKPTVTPTASPSSASPIS